MASPGRSDSKGGKSPHAGEKKATAAAAAASGRSDSEKAPAAGTGMTRLPNQEVTQILSLDPRSIKPYTVDALRKLAQEVRPNAPEAELHALAKVQNDFTRKKYVVFQNWVRGELDAKSYVEVPDEFIRDREEARKRQLVGHVDLCLPDCCFTTVEDGDGKEEFVFSFTKEETESGEDDGDESDGEDEESDEDDD